MEEEGVVLVRALMSPEKYFIFRNTGVQVTIKVFGDTILKSHKLTRSEEQAVESQLRQLNSNH